MPFQPGVSGNPGGRRKERPYRDALRKVLAEESDAAELQPKTKLEAVVRAHVTRAMAGDASSIVHIADRLDGKVPQAIVGDDDESPINVVNRIVREIVRPQPQDRDG